MAYHPHSRHGQLRERKKCCCCGAKIWTIVMAVVQIIIYLLELASVALLYTGVLKKFVIHGTGRPRSPDEEYGAIALVVIGGFFSLLGILAGIIFIKGALKSAVKYLTTAMVCGVLCYTWKLIEVGLEVGVSGGNILITFAGVGAITIVYIFSFWAAQVLKQEIKHGVWIGGVHLPRVQNPHVVIQKF